MISEAIDQQSLSQMAKEMTALKDTHQTKKALTIEDELEREKNITSSLRGEIKKAKRENAKIKQTVISQNESMVGNKKRRVKFNKIENLIFDVQKISLGFFRERKNSFRDLRNKVWDAFVIQMNLGDRVQCCHCGKLLDFKSFTVEHLKPKALGGGDDMKNLRPSCDLCNGTRPCEDISHLFNL